MKDLFAPFPGAIVMAWMPESEHACAPGPKFRPVLLLAENRRPDGTLEVLVAYGTSQQTSRNAPGEFTVRCQDAAFLAKDTRFSLNKRMWLSVTREYFQRDGKTKVLGSLPAKSLRGTARAAQEVGLA